MTRYNYQQAVTVHRANIVDREFFLLFPLFDVWPGFSPPDYCAFDFQTGQATADNLQPRNQMSEHVLQKPVCATPPPHTDGIQLLIVKTGKPALFHRSNVWFLLAGPILTLHHQLLSPFCLSG